MLIISDIQPGEDHVDYFTRVFMIPHIKNETINNSHPSCFIKDSNINILVLIKSSPEEKMSKMIIVEVTGIDRRILMFQLSLRVGCLGLRWSGDGVTNYNVVWG